MVKARRNTRDQLIAAMRSALASHGPDAPIAMICEDAGISPGNVHYQFGGKEGLLEATIRLQYRELAAVMRRHRPADGNPVAMLRSYIEANFDEAVYTPENCAIFRHLLSQSLLKERYRRLEQVFHRRFVSNVTVAFRSLVEKQNEQLVASLFVGALNGIFLRGGSHKDRLPAETARSLLHSELDALLSTYGITNS